METPLTQTPPITTEPTQVDPPLKKVYDWMRKKNSRFTRSFEEFQTDMQDEKRRKDVHNWLSEVNPAFTADYDQFSSDMGLAPKKKDQSGGELPKSPGELPASPEPTIPELSPSSSTLPPDPTEKVLSQNFSPDLAKLATIDVSKLGQQKSPEQLRAEFDQKNREEQGAKNVIADIEARNHPLDQSIPTKVINAIGEGAKQIGDIANDPLNEGASIAGHFNKAVITTMSSLPKSVAVVADELNKFTGLEEDKPVEEMSTYKAGQWLDDTALKLGITATDPDSEGKFWQSTIPQAFGSVAGIILTGGRSLMESGTAQGLEMAVMTPKGALGQSLKETGQLLRSPGTVSGGTAMAVPEFEAAKKAGLSDDEAFKVWLGNYLVGQTEILPLQNAIGRINKLSGGKLTDIVKAGVPGAFEEGLQETFQTVLTNKIAQGSYDPKRDLFTDVLESGGAGAFVGFFLPAIGAAMQHMSPEQKSETQKFLHDKFKTLEAENKVKAPEGDLGKPQANETPTGEQTNEQEKVQAPVQETATDSPDTGVASSDKINGTNSSSESESGQKKNSSKVKKPTSAPLPAEPAAKLDTDVDKTALPDENKSQQPEKGSSGTTLSEGTKEKSDEVQAEEVPTESPKESGVNDDVAIPDVPEEQMRVDTPVTKKVIDYYADKTGQDRFNGDLGSDKFYQWLDETELGSKVKYQLNNPKKAIDLIHKDSGKYTKDKDVSDTNVGDIKQDPHDQYIADVAPRLGTEDLNKIGLRKIAEKYGIDNDNHIKELTEVAIVQRAREIAKEPDAYEKLVDLYEKQPTLAHRTSESVAKQQYSTPIPIGYLAGKYINADKGGKTLEPSAGNGMLTIVADPANVDVNEIDDFRRQNLSRQNYANISDKDSSQPLGRDKEYDGVITNPPFGGTDVAVIDGYKFSELAQIMTVRALEAMKDNGKGAIIIGGNNKFDEEGRLSGRDRIFFNYLYNRYNVDDVIDMSGDLYRKQGASFPIRLILVNGRKAKPSGVAPSREGFGPVVKSFEDLKPRVEKYTTEPKTNPDENLQSSELVRGTTTTSDSGDKVGSTEKPSVVESQKSHSNEVSETSGEVDRGRTKTTSPDTGSAGSDVNTLGGSERDSGVNSEQPGVPLPNVDKGQANGVTEETESTGTAADIRRNRPGTDRKVVTGALSEQSGSIDYSPSSQGKSMNVKIPTSMAQEMYDAMSTLKDQVGDIDAFVQKKLKYKSKKEMYAALGAEQIDGVALAIKNIEDGNALIVGDQTGIGKGRQAAAIIRYANMIGKKPIFMSEKPNLFGAIYRDLKSIGHGHIKPFIVNNIGDKFNGVRDKEDGGAVIHKAYPSGHKDHAEVLRSMQIPDDVQIVLATYSQFGNPKFVDKINFIKAVSQDNIVILDESHNASGNDSNTGAVFQEVVPNAKGVVFLSGTYAKRPDNMPLYALKTSMKEANMTSDQMIEAVQNGGVALQEIVSGQLAEAGQLIRRQRSLEDVSVINEVLTEQADDHIKSADTITDLIRDIIRFQAKHVKPMISVKDKAAKKAGEIVKLTGGTNAAGVDNAPYFSKVFNIIDQMLYSLKAKSVAEWAVKQLKAGKKPFIAIRGTLESNLSDLLESGEVQYGDSMEADFNFIMQKGLNGVMKYTVKDAYGDSEVKKFTPQELGPSGAAEYYRIADKIKASVSGLSMSPIDDVVQTIEKAGYKVAEVTGRQSKLILSQGKKKMGILERKKREPVDEAYRKYNNGEYDVIVVNSSGSTGEDAHADAKFKDKRPRTMVVLQPELNINTLVQILGRINRTGQIHQPEYAFLNSVIPAEQRLMMMTMKKLKSLDANTTSNQKQSKGVLDVPEFFNKYGNQVVIEYLQENPDIIEMIGDPLKMASKEDLEPSSPEDAALRVSGRIAILPVADQEKFYNEISEQYNKQLEYLNEAGINDLEVTSLPLKAKTLAEKVTIVGKGGKSAFGDDTYLEEVEVDVLKKPMKRADINEQIKELAGDDPEAHTNKLYEQATEYEDKMMAELERKSDEDLEKALENLKSKEYSEEEMSEAIQATKDAFTTKLASKKKNEQFRIEYVKSLIRFFRPGRAVRVPMVLRADKAVGETMFYSDGIFMGFDINMQKSKPFLPSNIRMRFAVNDSRVSIPIPASKKGEINDIRGISDGLDPKRAKEIQTNWDTLKKPKARENRLIITGNILQGLGKYHDGKIIKYSTDDGFIKTGILLPEGYQEQEETAASTVSIPAAKSVTVIKNSSRYADFNSTDGKVKIRNEGGDRFSIRVPKSKILGGKYFLDTDILDLVEGNNFNSVGNDMEAFVNGARLPMVMDILQNKHGASIDINQRVFEKALEKKEIEMSKRSAQTYEPVAQLSLFPWLTPGTVKKKPVNQVAEDALRAEIEFKNTDAETRYKDAAEPTPSSDTNGRWNSIKDSFSHMVVGFTAHFRHLNPKKFARESNLLRVFETIKKSSAERTKQYLQGLVEPLTKEQYDIFTRRIVLEDLLGGIDKKLEDPDKLPFGFKSQKELEREIDKYRDLMAKEPAAQEAYDQRQSYQQTLYDALVDKGILFRDEDRATYYHRRVLEYLQEEANQKVIHGKRLSKSYKDWRRARTGTKGKDYSTNFIESEYRVVAEGLYELEKQRILNELMGPYEAALRTLKQKFNKYFQKRIEDLENQFGKGSEEVQALKKSKRSMMKAYIEENKPEGYVWYQPTPGNAIFVRKLVSQEQIEKTVERAALDEHSGIGTAMQLIENIVDMADPYVLVGQKRKEYLVPKPLADQLEDMGTNIQPDPNLLAEITSAWKVYVLLNPNRFLKYNLNNLFGDLDGTLAADPTILKKAGRAWKELREFKRSGQSTPELNEAIRQNVIDSGWELTELADINDAKWANMFGDQSKPDMDEVFGKKIYRETADILRTAPGKIWQWYWNKAKTWTGVRENVLRYAAYLHAKEKIEAGEKFYWASDPTQVDGISGSEYKAGKLAREVLGDYGNISLTGQRIRRYMVPFYSWLEINMGRYYRLFKNASDPKVQARIGAMMAARGVIAIAWRMMWAYGLMGMMTAMVEAWNWWRYPEETEKLRRANARGMQLILGQTEDGKVVTLPIVGAFYDFLDFFGLPDMKDDLALIFSGESPKKGAVGAAKTFLVTPYSKVVQGINPFGKMAYELLTQQQLFPDPTNPRPIYDYGEYFAQFLSLQDEYKALSGSPTRDPYFFGHLRNLIVKEIDPDELSYFMAKRIIDTHQGGKFEAKHDAKSEALYRYGLAIRFGKTDEALNWMNVYYANGGTPAGLNMSLKGKNPISKLKSQEESDVRELINNPNYTPRTAFGKSLTPKEIKIFRDAMTYYDRTYNPLKVPH
jgi:hypothetical protein